MKYLLSILAFWFCGSAYSQTVPTGVPQLFGGPYYEFRKYVLVDSLILMPCADTVLRPNKPAFVFNCADSTFYFWNTQRWNKLAKANDIYWQLDASNNLTNRTFAGDNIIPFKNMKLVQPGFTGSQFSTWPTGNNTSFNHNVLAIYGDEPSLDILIDSSSQFNIGGITFRGMDGIIPKLNAGRFGTGAAAKLEYNAFVNGDTTATVELYLGDKNATTIHTFAWSLPGNHFFGFRRQYTAESKEALMFGTAVRGVNSTQISGLTDTTYFAGDAGSKNMYIFNMPTVSVADTSNYRPWVTHTTTAATTRAYWSGLGLFSLGGLSGFAQTFATGTSGSDFAINSSGSTHTFNLPTASTTNRGALSSADWTTFNNKLSNITGHITAGANVTITGSGTLGSPYEIASSGGGGGSPGGSTTQLQYNNAGAFGGTSGATWDATNTGITVTKDALGVTQNALSGIMLKNSTAAAAGAQQISPPLIWQGQGWKTNATAASQPVEFRMYLVPVQGAASPSWQLLFQSSINGGAATNPFNFTSDGTFTASGQITATTHLGLGSSGQIIWSSSNRISSPSNGVMTLLNAAQTDFTRLQFGGTTSSFPSLSRSTTKLIAMLADNSARTNFGVLDEAYNATTWDGNDDVPTKNAVRDELEAMILTATTTLNFPNTTAGTSSDLTITVTGAADGDAVAIGVSNASTVANGCFTAWVSATNTVTIRFTNNDLTNALDPASGTFRATVFK